MSALKTIDTVEHITPPEDLPESKQRSRLLYLVTRAERGGAQTHVLTLAAGMSERFDVEVATGEEGFLTDACREQGIPVHVIPHFIRDIVPFEDLLGLRGLIQLMRRIQPDLVHAHTFKAGFLGRFAAKRLNIASVYTVHMWPFGSGMPLSWQLTAPGFERLAASWCARVISVSEAAATMAVKHRICDVSKMTSIWNSIPDHAARAPLDRKADLTCTMVARFSDFKDHALLLRAFAKVPGNPRLLLVGDGATLPASKELAAQLGIRHRVEFAGERADVPDLLAQSDVFVLASKTETLPISILEAMRAGLPVIASAVGGIAEEVIHGETGFLVTPGSMEALAAALELLLGNKELRIAMGTAGRERFEQLFLASTMIEKTAALYAEVLKERRIHATNNGKLHTAALDS